MSNSVASTEMVSIVLTRLVVLDPVDDSSFTFLHVGGRYECCFFVCVCVVCVCVCACVCVCVIE